MEVNAITAIVRALNGASVRYLIVGGIAVNAHGYVRYTKDIDLVISLEPSNIFNALKALGEIDYHLSVPVSAEQFSDPQTRESWRTEKGMLVLKLWSDSHQRTPIDIFIYEPFDIATELGQSLQLEIEPGVSVNIVSLPTLLDMKRDAAREQDLIDIKELTRLP